jgi:hypothetical protein
MGLDVDASLPDWAKSSSFSQMIPAQEEDERRSCVRKFDNHYKTIHVQHHPRTVKHDGSTSQLDEPVLEGQWVNSLLGRLEQPTGNPVIRLGRDLNRIHHTHNEVANILGRINLATLFQQGAEGRTNFIQVAFTRSRAGTIVETDFSDIREDVACVSLGVRVAVAAVKIQLWSVALGVIVGNAITAVLFLRNDKEQREQGKLVRTLTK